MGQNPLDYTGETLENCLYYTAKLVKIFQLDYFSMKMTMSKYILLAKEENFTNELCQCDLKTEMSRHESVHVV